MRNVLLVLFMVFVLVGTAQAGLYTFSFDNLNAGETSGAYMSRVYGSQVTVTGASVLSNSGSHSWPGDVGSSLVLQAGGQVGSFEIDFGTQLISSLVGNATRPGTTMGYIWGGVQPFDIDITAYDEEHRFVSTTTYSRSATGQVDFSTIAFGTTPIRYLDFSDHRNHDIGIDNLTVTTAVVPLPASILLGAFAVGLAGRKLRKFV